MSDDLDFFVGLAQPQQPPEPLPPAPATGPIDDFIPEPDKPLVVDTGQQQVDAILQAVPQADKTVVQNLVSKSTKAFVEALLNPDLSKRAVWIRNAILRQGWTTYAQIREQYAEYRRAKRDVLDAGLPLRARSINSSDGRTILLEFDPLAFERQREGRSPLSANEVEELKARFGHLCNRCHSPEHRRALEADHRVGFALVGNSLHEDEGLDAFQPLCGSCNTKKSRACIDCPNEDPDLCRSCSWAYPESYTHVATVPERRCELVIHDPALVRAFDKLWPRVQSLATQRGSTPGEILVRAVLSKKASAP